MQQAEIEWRCSNRHVDSFAGLCSPMPSCDIHVISQTFQTFQSYLWCKVIYVSYNPPHPSGGRKLIKTSHTEERIAHTNWGSWNKSIIFRHICIYLIFQTNFKLFFKIIFSLQHVFEHSWKMSSWQFFNEFYTLLRKFLVFKKK